MKRVDQLLANLADASSRLRIRDAMRDDARLRQSISRIVPPQTMEKLAFCRLENAVLHLSVADSVWLTRLRFVERALLAELTREGWEVTAVKGHVLPRRAPVEPRQPALSPSVKSSSGADGIHQLANSLDAGRLREALEKMANHLGRPPGQ